MGARNRVGVGLYYRPARLHRLAESIPGVLKNLKIPSQYLRRKNQTWNYYRYLQDIYGMRHVIK